MWWQLFESPGCDRVRLPSLLAGESSVCDVAEPATFGKGDEVLCGMGQTYDWR